jgi:hypothetical protein
MGSWLPPRLTCGRCAEQRLPVLAVHGVLPATARRGGHDGHSPFSCRNVAAVLPVPVSARGRVGKPAASRGRLVSRQKRQCRVAGESAGAGAGRIVSRESRFALYEMVTRCVGTGERTGESLVHGVLACVRLPGSVAAARGEAGKTQRRCRKMHADARGWDRSARIGAAPRVRLCDICREIPRSPQAHPRASACIFLHLRWVFLPLPRAALSPPRRGVAWHRRMAMCLLAHGLFPARQRSACCAG